MMKDGKTRWMAMLLIAVLIQGCATRGYVHRPTSPDLVAQLEPGDEVLLKLRDGRRFRGVVHEVTDTELITRKSRYRIQDLAYVEYKRTEAGRTVLGSLVVVYTAGVIAFFYLAVRSLDLGNWDFCS